MTERRRSSSPHCRRTTRPSAGLPGPRPVPGSRNLRRQVEHLLRLHEGAGSFLRDPRPNRRPPGRSRRPPNTHRRPKPPARSSAPTSCSSRSARAAWAPSAWPSRQQPVQRVVALKVIKPGMDSPPGARPLRGRAPGPGPDGPSEHRQGPRRRGDRARPALLRHGAGQGRAHHPLLRREAPHAPRAAGAVHPGLPGGAARPPEGDHPPRPEAVQRPGRPVRRQAGAQGHRLRRGQGDRAEADRGDAVHRLRRRSSARRST